MNTTIATRTLAILLVLAVAGVSGAAHADKLVVFKNGKALKARSIVEDGQWLRCEFENNNFISVKADLVLKIEEAAIGASDADLRFNKVAVGSGYTPPPAQRLDDGGGAAAQAQIENQRAQQQQELDDAAAAALAEEQQAIRNQGGVFLGNNTNGRRVGLGNNVNQQQQQNGPIPGLTPLNQPNTPFQSRRSLSQREQQRRSRFGAPPAQEQQPDGNEQN